ncbi:hypothetical protein Tco_0786473 [Tanacetum coccineum]
MSETTIEIGLSTKRKLEFIRGTVPTDANLAELWDTCNNMEESQRVLFGSSSVESTALLSKGKFQEKYSICGFKWHPSEKCQVTVAHVESGNVSFTPQQFEQLLRSFQIKNAAADDDFAVGIACLGTQLELLELLEDWIYDTRATDHMKPIDKDILDPYMLQIKPQIKLPNGNTSVISHVGKIKLNNGADKCDGQSNAEWNPIEEPIEIVDREVKRLKQSRIPIVKVRWFRKEVQNLLWNVRIRSRESTLISLQVRKKQRKWIRRAECRDVTT